MLNLSVPTKLTVEKAMDRCYRYFVEEQGLKLMEWIVHLHADQGACELRVTGGDIKGKKEMDSKELLLSETERLTSEYGLEPVHYGLHLHTVPDEAVGHLMISVKEEQPVEIAFESQELDSLVKEFAGGLPKA
jgi:hypothetical protein